jgi:hypothetical protein
MIVIQGVFIMIFPYIHVLYPGLVHYSPSYPSPLLKTTSAGFNIPYLNFWPGAVAHICNLSNLGGRNKENHDLRPAQEKTMRICQQKN